MRFDLLLDHLFLFRTRNRDDVLTRFGAGAQQDVQRRVAAIVQDHVRAVLEQEGFVQIIPVLFQRLTLDGEDRNTRLGDRGGGVILGREDVARRPAHIRAQRHQRFNQNSGLDGHVQRSNDPRPFKRLAVAVFRAQGHQARHLGFGDVQLFAAKPASEMSLTI